MIFPEQPNEYEFCVHARAYIVGLKGGVLMCDKTCSKYT